MRRNAVMLAGLLLVTPTIAHAQGSSMYAWIGVEAAMPIGDSKDALDMGFLATAGLGRTLTGKLSLQVEGLFGSISAKVGDGSTKLMGGLVNLGYDFAPGTKFNPYIFAGGGMLNAKPEGFDGETESAYQIGGGFSRSMSAKWGIWVDVRYLASGSGASKMTLLPIAAGITLPF